MKRNQADIKDMAKAMKLVDTVLQNIPDEQLLAEVRCRGLKLE
jgi:hypothetical protein